MGNESSKPDHPAPVLSYQAPTPKPPPIRVTEIVWGTVAACIGLASLSLGFIFFHGAISEGEGGHNPLPDVACGLLSLLAAFASAVAARSYVNRLNRDD